MILPLCMLPWATAIFIFTDRTYFSCQFTCKSKSFMYDSNTWTARFLSSQNLRFIPSCFDMWFSFIDQFIKILDVHSPIACYVTSCKRKTSKNRCQVQWTSTPSEIAFYNAFKRKSSFPSDLVYLAKRKSDTYITTNSATKIKEKSQNRVVRKPFLYCFSRKTK